MLSFNSQVNDAICTGLHCLTAVVFRLGIGCSCIPRHGGLENRSHRNTAESMLVAMVHKVCRGLKQGEPIDIMLAFVHDWQCVWPRLAWLSWHHPQLTRQVSHEGNVDLTLWANTAQMDDAHNSVLETWLECCFDRWQHADNGNHVDLAWATQRLSACGERRGKYLPAHIAFQIAAQLGVLWPAESISTDSVEDSFQ